MLIFMCLLLSLNKKHRQIKIIAPFLDYGAKMSPKVIPKAPQKDATSIKKIRKIVSEPPWAPTGDF